jgi:hypothetical protein
MAQTLHFEDFKLVRAVCELRYADAYLIFDRTGQVLEGMRTQFTDVRVQGPSPTQTTIQTEEGSFSLQLGQCHFTADHPDPNLGRFAAHCKAYFGIVMHCMEIKILSRIGFRVLLRKNFAAKEESLAALASLSLLNRKPALRFGASQHPHEVLVRWESDKIGATVRLKAESAQLEATLAPEFEAKDPVLKKSLEYLLLDVDYYTVAPVDREQWDAAAWIPESVRLIRRETNVILEERA